MTSLGEAFTITCNKCGQPVELKAWIGEDWIWDGENETSVDVNNACVECVPCGVYVEIRWDRYG